MPSQQYPPNDPQYPQYPQGQGNYPSQENYAQQEYNDTTEQISRQGDNYVQRQHQTYKDPAGNRVEKRQVVSKDFTQSMINTRYWITSVIYFLLGVLEVILGLRFIFRLLGANQGSAFIDFLYNLSHPFVAIFNGIFTDPVLGNSNSVFEVSTILGMLIYALIAWGIVSLVRIVFFPNIPSRREATTTRRRTR
ncbi:YggT family protein [Dictyobacter arantiisoli]|uniref:YggT family protein n=1 Tax=Dictyobacter arantiisoli TaxID=2014874 RepID=A0A5A5TCK0_9CHLR|nr:YggT family protein [Dictyobacter arantiisoli]GCF08915.1 hypothetical protein KDI_24790 [Dictyobacter arantiisoli]